MPDSIFSYFYTTFVWKLNIKWIVSYLFISFAYGMIEIVLDSLCKYPIPWDPDDPTNTVVELSYDGLYLASVIVPIVISATDDREFSPLYTKTKSKKTSYTPFPFPHLLVHIDDPLKLFFVVIKLTGAHV